MLKPLFGEPLSGFNALSAGVIMGFMVVPTIASISEDAMSAVPAALREGAFGLGATKLQVSTRVVFPAALSGIVASIVLGASRAIGETMIVAHRRGPAAEPHGRPARVGRDDDDVHRRDGQGRRPGRVDRLRDDLRRRDAALRHDARS